MPVAAAAGPDYTPGVAPNPPRFAVYVAGGWTGSAIGAGAGHALDSSSCLRPIIRHVTPFSTARDQTVRITGECLGSRAPYYFLDTPFLEIRDTARAGWHACQVTTGYDDPRSEGMAYWDKVTCSVEKWTNREIVFTGFGGSFGTGRFVLHRGDTVQVKVINPDLGAGSAHVR